MHLQKDISVQPHLHLKNLKKTTKSSEAWILMSGCIEATFFDIDKSKLYKTILIINLLYTFPLIVYYSFVDFFILIAVGTIISYASLIIYFIKI